MWILVSFSSRSMYGSLCCFFDDFSTFNQTVGTYEELQTYLEGYVANLARADEKRHAK